MYPEYYGYGYGYGRNPQPIKYRGTITDLRISSVDGTAFIDNAGATIPTYADGNHQIEIYDSAGRALKGVLKAVGSGITVDDELIVTPDFSSATGWTTTSSSWTIAGGVATNDGSISDHQCRQDVATTVGALYRVQATFARTSGAYSIFFPDGINALGWWYTASVTQTGYRTATAVSSTWGIYPAPYNGTADDASAKKVLTPSTSGAVIVNAKGGVTYNFTSKNASFTYNAASYYCVVKELR